MPVKKKGKRNGEGIQTTDEENPVTERGPVPTDQLGLTAEQARDNALRAELKAREANPLSGPTGGYPF